MKKRLTILIAVVLLALSLTACGKDEKTSDPISNSSNQSAIVTSRFAPIEGEPYLVYDIYTKNIYYKFSEKETPIGYKGYGYGYFGPYINENGHYCKYLGDEIVDIETLETT